MRLLSIKEVIKIKKIILIVLIALGISSVSFAGWWQIVHFKWDDTDDKNYSVSVKWTVPTGTVHEYSAALGDRNQFDMDIDPRGGVHEVKFYSAGNLMFESVYIPNMSGAPKADITF